VSCCALVQIGDHRSMVVARALNFSTVEVRKVSGALGNPNRSGLVQRDHLGKEEDRVHRIAPAFYAMKSPCTAPQGANPQERRRGQRCGVFGDQPSPVLLVLTRDSRHSRNYSTFGLSSARTFSTLRRIASARLGLVGDVSLRC
jgi:hypothetical protein